MGLLLMDIDRFKSINDTYGHYSGDEALVEIATLLKRIVGGRRLLISRYGGDEFLIAGDFIGDEDEHGLKRQILEVVAQRNRTTKTPYPLMLSIGTAHMDKGCTLTFDQMIALADVELYAEKVAHNAEIR
jgi:diguanylate cyclase (GGDEF)-like protein